MLPSVVLCNTSSSILMPEYSYGVPIAVASQAPSQHVMQAKTEGTGMMSTASDTFGHATKAPVEDRIRMRNRLAQRRHRESKCLAALPPRVETVSFYAQGVNSYRHAPKEKKNLSRTNNDDVTGPSANGEEQTQALAQPLPSPDLTLSDAQWDEDHLNVADYLYGRSAGDAGKLIHSHGGSANLGQGRDLDDRATIMDVLTSLASGEGGETASHRSLQLSRVASDRKRPGSCTLS